MITKNEAEAGTPVKSGPWYILLGATLWGTNGTAQALAPAGAQSLVVGTLRQLIGGIGLLVLALGRGELTRSRWQSWPWRLTWLAGFFIAAYQLCFFSGVARTGVAVGTIVGIGSTPIAGGVIGWLLRGERPSPRWYLSTLLAIAGCGLLALSGGDLRVNGLGLLLAMGAGVSYALYAHFSKYILLEHPPDVVMAIIFGIGALLLLPVLFVYDWSWVWQPAGILVVLHLGLITTTLAYGLFARGLPHVSIATTMTLTLAEPLTAALLDILVLQEEIRPLAAVGIGLLLVGLAILTVRGRAPQSAID